MEPKVTVLMAVYNAALYLSRSIGSLQKQTLSDIQIICVDDCSTDDSLDILYNYAQEDSRIKVVHLNKNCGPAQARQAGLPFAASSLIAFLDSDDWLSEDALMQAYSTFLTRPEVGCVLFRLFLCDAEGHKNAYPMDEFQILSGTDAFFKSIDWKGIHGYAVFRRNVYDCVETDYSNFTFADENMTRLRLYYAGNVVMCTGCYYYCEVSTSITRHFSVRRFDVLRNNEHMRDIICQLHLPHVFLSKHENMRYQMLIDLSSADRRYVVSEMHRVWLGIDRSLLTKIATHKFGYRPCRYWWLFRLQEWIYFTLRGWLGR